MDKVLNIMLSLSIVICAISACMVDSESWIPIIVFSVSVMVAAGCATIKEELHGKDD